mgnify:CR=1 FL=1
MTSSEPIASWRENTKDRARVWLADGALDASGRLCLDGLLGIALPDDYEPVRVREFELTSNGVLPMRSVRFLKIFDILITSIFNLILSYMFYMIYNKPFQIFCQYQFLLFI